MEPDQTARTTELLNTVVRILTRLMGTYGCWAITGSANLALRGVQIIPSDIDIITTCETADHFSLLTKNIAPLEFRLSENDTIQSYYAKMKLHGFPIDVMANPVILTKDGTWQKLDFWYDSVEFVQTTIGLVPLTSLEFEYYVYSLLGIGDRVKIIDSQLRESRQP